MASMGQELASDRLGRPVAQWIAKRRATGASWALISAELYAKTGLAVSHTTLRTWALEPAA